MSAPIGRGRDKKVRRAVAQSGGGVGVRARKGRKKNPKLDVAIIIGRPAQSRSKRVGPKVPPSVARSRIKELQRDLGRRKK